MGGGGTFDESFRAQFSVVIAETDALIDETLRLRYAVYCLERAFEDPARSPDGHERDGDDARAVHALVRHTPTGACAGSVRLVFGRGAPLPLERYCGGAVLERLRGVPCERVAEISRFAVAQAFRRRRSEAAHVEGLSPGVEYADTGAGARRMPHVTIGLFAAIVQLSIAHGVTHWLAVMEPALLRLLTSFGIVFAPLGPLVDYHGRRQPALAIGAEVEACVRLERPDVWAIVTDGGRYLPP